MTDEAFLQRWSRLKRATPEPEVPAAPRSAGELSEPPAPEPATEKDLIGLDASSDYARFLDPRVSSSVRVAALRTLWRSDPSLSTCDGLIDYAGDYTGA